MGKHGRSCQKMNLWSFPAIVAGRQTWLRMPMSKTNTRLPLKSTATQWRTWANLHPVPCVHVLVWLELPPKEQHMGLKLSGAQGVGHCGSGGAQAKWLWNSEAGLMLMLTMMLILMMMTKTFSGHWWWQIWWWWWWCWSQADPWRAGDEEVTVMMMNKTLIWRWWWWRDGDDEGGSFKSHVQASPHAHTYTHNYTWTHTMTHTTTHAQKHITYIDPQQQQILFFWASHRTGQTSNGGPIWNW